MFEERYLEKQLIIKQILGILILSPKFFFS
jgi:hypothetical protein